MADDGKKIVRLIQHKGKVVLQKAVLLGAEDEQQQEEEEDQEQENQEDEAEDEAEEEAEEEAQEPSSRRRRLPRRIPTPREARPRRLLRCRGTSGVIQAQES